MSPVRIAVIILAALVGSLGLALFARTLAAPPKKMTHRRPDRDRSAHDPRPGGGP